MQKNITEAVLIYPHQLFEENTLLSDGRVIFLIEEPLFFTQYAFHKQKLVLHRASMKAYQDMITAKGYTVEYVAVHDLQETKAIAKILQKRSIKQVHFFDVVDNRLETRLIEALQQSNITHTIYETPLFLTERETLTAFFDSEKGKRKYFMKNFYEWQRRRLSILIEKDGTPTGGAWSFDTENRKKIPKGLRLPSLPTPSTHKCVLEAKAYVEEYFSNNYGDDSGFFYPITHDEARLWLGLFLKDKLALFGPYEDAITTGQGLLFHSVLSPLLNIGLLTPAYVVERAISYAKGESDVPIPSLEGFLRQIIGWREYMRAIYIRDGKNIRTKNYFNGSRDIPKSFWQGTTGIDPIDHTIQGALRTGYSHHIERLMVMGNFMNLCGFRPDQVYVWFMEMYIDAYDWVMVPNVYSMALYADGGLITTKPYISGSNYILKMSDYKKGAWSDIWDALFWNFVGKYFEVLQKEGRLGFIAVLYSKMSEEKKQDYNQKASDFLKSLV
jgi:deoxyribodipyrimidine photolyase-related protein